MMIGMIGGFWFLFLRPVELDCNLSLCATKLDRYEESNQVLQITGVDWYEPEAKVVEKVRQLVGSSPTVAVKRLPRSPRKRDVGKLNGGSARVTFNTVDEASRAYQQLQSSPWQVRWAWVLKDEFSERESELTEEVILKRKLRAEQYARRRQRIGASTDALLSNLPAVSKTPLSAPTLDWSECPSELDPAHGGKLTALRMNRKRATVEAFLHVLKDGIIGQEASSFQLYDMGSGTGNLILPLTWWLREMGFEDMNAVAVDRNNRSLELLEERASTLPIESLCIDMNEISDLSPSAVVVSLHACGIASDLALKTAVESSLPFVISPCCIGKVKSAWEKVERQSDLTYPRSTWLRNQLAESAQYSLLASAADFGFTPTSFVSPEEWQRRERCRKAKTTVETDRLKWATETADYCVHMFDITGLDESYAKRELLVGAPRNSLAAQSLANFALRL